MEIKAISSRDLIEQLKAYNFREAEIRQNDADGCLMGRFRLHLVLFLLTVLSTLFAGAYYIQEYDLLADFPARLFRSFEGCPVFAAPACNLGRTRVRALLQFQKAPRGSDVNLFI